MMLQALFYCVKQMSYAYSTNVSYMFDICRMRMRQLSSKDNYAMIETLFFKKYLATITDKDAF